VSLEVGCNTYTLRSLGRPAAFRRLAAAGLTDVELWAGHAPYADVGELAAREVRRDAAEHGIRLRAYCVGGLFGLLPAAVEARLERAVAFARALEVGLVTLIRDPDVVHAAAAIAERAGVRLALENHWYTRLGSPADVRRALAEVSPDVVGATIDVGHFAFLGYDPVAVARELGGVAFHVHVKAVRRPTMVERAIKRARRSHKMDAVPPGPRDGLDGFVAALAAAGYGGGLAIEDEWSGDDRVRLARWRARVEALVVEARERPAGQRTRRASLMELVAERFHA
jgi:sugar phosphate isomerase/epimerase